MVSAPSYRILRTESVAPDQLLANPDNYKIHAWYQQQALRSILERIGILENPKVNELTGRVLDGHLRISLALQDDIPSIDVDIVRLSEEEEAQALATLDTITRLADSDPAIFADLLADCRAAQPELAGTLDTIHHALFPGDSSQAIEHFARAGEQELAEQSGLLLVRLTYRVGIYPEVLGLLDTACERLPAGTHAEAILQVVSLAHSALEVAV